MELITFLIDLFLHLDEHLANIISRYGTWTYALLFFVIFMETGFVVTPFLPGDSLLFAAGTFASPVMGGALNVYLLVGLLTAAAILGDTVNYWIGHFIGERAYGSRWVKKEYIDRTHAFFEKHGGKTIFLARFVPIIRTFAPFVAGVGKMSYGYFLRRINFDAEMGSVCNGSFCASDRGDYSRCRCRLAAAPVGKAGQISRRG